MKASLMPFASTAFLILMMWQRQPCGIPEIGGKDRETGLSYPVEINLLAEVELMIAENESIEPHIVEEIDHVGALVEARQQARRQRIAGVDANKMTVLGERSGAFRLYYSRETRHAAASVPFFDPVDIVDQKKGNTGGGAVGMRGTRGWHRGTRACSQNRCQGLTAGEFMH